MDHAVSLVQTYLQLNGYFTSAEYPIIASARHNGVRTITDIDILAFRFPSGLPIGDPSGKRAPQGLDVSELDSGLGVPPDAIDMIIGEVKEGRVGINMGTRDPEVLKVAIGRLGDAGSETERVVGDLSRHGTTKLPTGGNMRPLALCAFPPGAPFPPARIITLRPDP